MSRGGAGAAGIELGVRMQSLFAEVSRRAAGCPDRVNGFRGTAEAQASFSTWLKRSQILNDDSFLESRGVRSR
jgi:hypothetical protein